MADRDINTKYTLLDRAKRTNDGKTVLPILNVMNLLVDDFFKDVPFVEANMGLQHKLVRDTGMADSSMRGFYQGVGSTKRNTQSVLEGVALLERRREIDEDEIDTLANPQEALRQEDEGHIQKLGEDVADTFFNGSVTSGGEYINGLKSRLGALNPSGLNNVISNGYGSTGSSVYIVEWNPLKGQGAFGIYPPGFIKNTLFGIAARDKGKEVMADADDATKKYYAYVAQFKAWMGLAVGNNRKIARLANINPTVGGTDSFSDGGPENLITLLNTGRFDLAKTRIYVNPSMKAQMDVYALNKSNTLWPTMEVFGRPVMTFQGIPIRVTDVISSAETVVS